MVKNFSISSSEISLLRISMESKLNELSKIYKEQPQLDKEEFDQEMDAYEKLLKRLRAMETGK